jgi:hypothetical protein
MPRAEGGAGLFSGEAAAAAVCGWEEGGCVVVLGSAQSGVGRQQRADGGGPLALSCWKSEGHWLQLRPMDRGELKAIRAALSDGSGRDRENVG